MRKLDADKFKDVLICLESRQDSRKLKEEIRSCDQLIE
jgi:hypothetical protein